MVSDKMIHKASRPHTTLTHNKRIFSFLHYLPKLYIYAGPIYVTVLSFILQNNKLLCINCGSPSEATLHSLVLV